MPSTAIRQIRFEPENNRLIVVFVSGRTYAYENVPADIYEAFKAAPARGTYFNEWIRDRYDCSYVA
jgi:lysyl-tRNA synthetase class 2